MQFSSYIFILAVVVSFGRAEVTLKEGKNSTVTFEGSELIIKVDNPQSKKGPLKLCFGSRPDADYDFCPTGYGGISINILERTETYKLNRHGKLTGMGGTYRMSEDVVFNRDGSINVLVVAMPNGMAVNLPNAALPIVTTTTLAPGKKESSDKAVIGIVCGGIILLLIILIIGGVLFYCLWYKKRSHKPVPVAVPEDEVHRIDEINEPQDPLLPEIVVEPRAPPPKRPVAPSATTTTTTTRRTSTSATPSDEKPQVVAAPKPAPVPTTPLVIVMPSDAVSLTSASTQMESPGATPKRKSRKSKSKASKKSRRRASRTPIKTPIEKPGSPSLPVDKTQSPTMPSTQATPEFPDDPLTNAQAASSRYKRRDYLKRSEAPVPGSSRSRSRSRSRPIVDEVREFELQTESYACFAQREEKLDGHNQMMITERIDLKKPHNVSQAERTLLKAAPEDAPALADIVVEEADKAMAPFLHGHPIGTTERPELWSHFNAVQTPASDGYIAIYRLVPSIFKLQKHSLADPLVRKMPICGLYTLLLDRQLPRAFRVALAAEIRTRASRILPRVQLYQMKEVAFPTNYLMLIYNKNRESFVEGKEIHSAVPKRR